MTAIDDLATQDLARRLLPVNRGSWVVDRARISLQRGIARLGSEGTSPIDPEQLWARSDDRARERHAHGFTFFADWVGGAPESAPDEQRALTELVLSTVKAWDERFGRNRGTAPEMAYHDETTAQRLLAITAALDMLALEDDERAALRDVAGRTALILMEPEFYSGQNNHGMFQDLALLAWSILAANQDEPARSEAWGLAEQRLKAYFTSCFTPEGVHVENTPTYHVMVSRNLPILAGIFRHAGAASAELYESLLAGAEHYAVHCVAPDGQFPPVSDTQRRRIDTALNLRTFTGGEFEFASTRGASGRKPEDRTAVFPASGYAMTRSAWGDDDATFAYFSCAYNADYHKHSDELSVFLRSGGRDLLCEAGAYGYNWNDPLTKYAYSSAAHNTMLVDGAGLPRTEQVPVGDETAPLNELSFVDAQSDLLDATGVTRRYRGRVWSRRLVVGHGESPADSRIRVEDDVRSAVGAANLRFLWHIGPGLRVVLRARGAEVFDGSTKVMEIDVRTSADIVLSVVEGVEGSRPQGWYHPSFGEKVPAPVLMVDCWQHDVQVETEFRLSGFVWGGDGRESLQPLVEAGPAMPAWSRPADGSQAVVVLAPYSTPADRDRLTAELEKSGVPHWYVPGPQQDASEVSSPDLALSALETTARAVTDLIRSERRRGVDVLLGIVGDAFVPGAMAALSTGAPLIGLDPKLPFVDSDARAARLAAQLSVLTATGESPRMQLVVTNGAEGDADRALRFLDPARVQRRPWPGLSAADAEDSFSDVLRNALEVTKGLETRYIAGYDRRNRRFVVELPDQEDVTVTVRVFHGKNEVATMPPTQGSSHRFAFEGRGPHRLRIHVRDSADRETFAFTTGVVRVR